MKKLTKVSFSVETKTKQNWYSSLLLGYLPYLPGMPNPWSMLQSEKEPDMEAKLKEVKAELVSWIINYHSLEPH